MKAVVTMGDGGVVNVEVYDLVDGHWISAVNITGIEVIDLDAENTCPVCQCEDPDPEEDGFCDTCGWGDEINDCSLDQYYIDWYYNELYWWEDEEDELG